MVHPSLSRQACIVIMATSRPSLLAFNLAMLGAEALPILAIRGAGDGANDSKKALLLFCNSSMIESIRLLIVCIMH